LGFHCFCFLNLMSLGFPHFGFLYFWFGGFKSGDRAIASPGLDVHQKYRIYTILGEKKKNSVPFFFLFSLKKKFEF
jgi:hypothetical protein